MVEARDQNEPRPETKVQPQIASQAGQHAPTPAPKPQKPFDSLSAGERKAIQATAGVANNFVIFGLDNLIELGAGLAGYEVEAPEFAKLSKKDPEYLSQIDWKKRLDEAMARVMYWALHDYAEHPLIMLALLLSSRPMQFKYVKKLEKPEEKPETTTEDKPEEKPKPKRRAKSK